jgi:hypothetical protein
MAAVEKRYSITLPTVCIAIDDSAGQRPDVSISLPPTVLAIDPPPEVNKPHNFPEGGLKAHLTVLGAFMALACTFGQLSAFGTFQAWYSSHQLQHMPASTISWIGSLQFWVFFFSVRFDFDLSFTRALSSFKSSGCYRRTLVWCIWANLVNDCRDSLLSHKHVDN